MGRLVDLPFEILELIALPLDAKQRALLFCTCRRLRDFEGAAPGLWEWVRNLALSGPQQSMRAAHWLSARKAGVRHLQLSSRYTDRQSGAHSVLLGGALAGAPVESVEWSVRGCVELGASLCSASLPRLAVLAVGAVEGRVSLRAALGGAATLRVLRVWGSAGVEMEAGCLPPGVQELDLQQPPTTAVRVCSGAAASLRRLSLWRCRASLDCTHLSSLTALTSLALAGCHLASVPASLSSLSSLEELNLASNRLEGEGWAHLLPLRRLARLDLRHQLGNRRLELPGSLLCTPALQELLVADNPFTEALPLPAPSSAAPMLRTLSADFEVAARSHAALGRLPALQRLRLVAATGQVGVAGPRLEDAAALVGLLSRVPGLRVCWWDSLGGHVEFEASQALQLCQLVLRVAQRYPPLLGMSLA